MADLGGVFVTVDVLSGDTGGPGSVAVSFTEGVPTEYVVYLLRCVADNLEGK